MEAKESLSSLSDNTHDKRRDSLQQFGNMTGSKTTTYNVLLAMFAATGYAQYHSVP